MTPIACQGKYYCASYWPCYYKHIPPMNTSSDNRRLAENYIRDNKCQDCKGDFNRDTVEWCIRNQKNLPMRCGWCKQKQKALPLSPSL